MTNDNSIIKLSADCLLSRYTQINNLFVSEYMKKADDVQIKVYIYGLFLVSNGEEATAEKISKGLGLDDESVKKAYLYWDTFGVVKIRKQDPFFVEYLEISHRSFKPRKIDVAKYADFNKHIQLLISGRMMNPNEFIQYSNIMEGYGFSPEAFILIVNYAVKKNGKNVPAKYITETAINLSGRKILTYAQLDEYFTNYFLQSSSVSDVLEAMNSKRKVETSDYDMFEKWKEMGFSKEAILAGARTLKGKKSIEKLDKLMGELFSSKMFSKEEINKFQNHKNHLFEITIKINKAIAVYYEVLETVVEKYTKRWVDVLGFTENVLVQIAENCFMSGVRTLEGMNMKVEKFAKIGITNTEALAEYMYKFTVKENKIKKIMDLLGFSRKINNFDRENFDNFEKLGMSFDLILFASEKAVGTHSPFPYIYATLKNWKRGDVTTVEEAKKFVTMKVESKKADEIHTQEYSKEEIANAFSSLETFDF